MACCLDQELEQEQGQDQGLERTEEAQLWLLQEVQEEEQCKVEGQVVAGVGVQAWGSLAGIQQGSSKEAEEGPHSPREAVQSLERKGGDRLSEALWLSQSIKVFMTGRVRLLQQLAEEKQLCVIKW